MMYNVLIVDDESHARERLKKYIKSDSELKVAGECSNGVEAVESISKQQPDIVFLDVQMPKMDGLGVIETVGAENMPVVIFVTAYDRFAIQAFKVNAMDYVLKPVAKDRFIESINRAKNSIQNRKNGELNRRLLNLLEEMKPQKQYIDRIMVKSSDRMYLIKTEDIDWIEADDNYVKLHVGPKYHLLRQTMKSLEDTLDPDIFLRIHRSVIVNMDRIKEIQQWFNNEYTVILKDGTELTMSRGYKDKAKEMFKNFN
ncbi:MAG TPA: LytTR family DNA-binding domain-containing protein [Balneolales bacterium]|nr:LytTR family DNA-binding domain-containing protein [Balneolales bacterium]